MLNTWTAGPAQPDRPLTLKGSFHVVILRSFDTLRGHVHNTRYTVRAVYIHLFMLQSGAGDNAGKIFPLPKIASELRHRNIPIQRFTRTQFTARDCFMITVNEVQEKAFCDTLGLDLNDTVLAHGQLYVGVSTLTHRNTGEAFFSPNSDTEA